MLLLKFNWDVFHNYVYCEYPELDGYLAEIDNSFYMITKESVGWRSSLAKNADYVLCLDTKGFLVNKINSKYNDSFEGLILLCALTAPIHERRKF